MLDTMAQGRLVVGLLRGTANEAMTYDLNPQEARERTDEGMELILKAWTEPQPFGWQGRHFQYRTVSIWPRPLQQPHPPTFALGTSRESCEFAARHHLGCGVSYGPFEVMAKATRYYREQCARHGWQPSPEQIVYRANMLVAETDEEAHALLRAQPNQAPFTMRAGVRDAVMALDSRNIAGEARAPVVAGALPTTFVGSPDTVVEQVTALSRGGRRGRPRPVPAPAGIRRSRSTHARAGAVRQEGAAAHPRAVSGGGSGAVAVPRGHCRDRRLPDPIPGGRAGDSAGAPARRGRIAPHPWARPPGSPLPRAGVRAAGWNHRRQPAPGARDRDGSASTPSTSWGRRLPVRRRSGWRSRSRGACAPSCWRHPPRSGPTNATRTSSAGSPAWRRRPSCCSVPRTTWSRPRWGASTRRRCPTATSCSSMPPGTTSAPIGRRRSPRWWLDFLERHEAFVISRAQTVIHP